MEADSGSAEARVGSTLKGKYTLERLIGVGGMAAVYRGTHRNGNRVAVKVLQPSLSHNGEIRDRFLREGYVANKVDHRGAVRVLDDDIADDGSVFLVMELLEGETVGSRWERNGNKLPAREVVELAVQLLDVLAAAHDKGIVHRDIKPENLFLTREGVLKVLDFGIARLRDPMGGGHASATRSGRMLGTPAYMPPEQVLGRTREIDGQTDLWSVGATMFSLLSGQFVHAAETVEELLVYTGSRPARAIASVAPEVAPPIAAVVDHALAFDKAKRWPNARAMQAALERAYAATFGTPIARVNSSHPGAAPAAADEHAPTGSAPHSPALAPTLEAGASSGPATPPPAIAPSGPEVKAAATFPSASASTTGGVAEPSKAPPGMPGRALWVGIAGAVILAGVVGAVALSGSRDRASSPAAASSPPAAATSAPPETSTATTPAVSVVALSDPAPVIEAGATSVSPPPRSAVAPPRPVQPPSPAPPAKANCNPPYTIDAAGRRIPRPECL